MPQKETQSKRQEKSATRKQESQSVERRENKDSQTGIVRREFHAPVTWPGSPFSFMRRFSEQMDRFFEDFGLGRGLGPSFGRDFGRLADLESSLWSPQVEVFERGNQLIVRADLPGLTRDDIDVDITDEAIVIRGERRQEKKEDEEGYYRTERSYGSFFRSIPLPEGVNADDANASFRNGVLEIPMPAPKRAEQHRRRLEISEAPETGQQPQSRAKAAAR
jgi:HSP20 family protein